MTDLLKRRGTLIVVLALALTLRVAYALTQDPLAAYAADSADSSWYLDNGLRLLVNGLPAPAPTAPLYLLFLGGWQMVLPPGAAVTAVYLTQALVGTMTCYLVYRLTLTVSGDERAGVIAAGALAINPAFVADSAAVVTEPLYIFWLVGGLLAVASLLKRDHPAYTLLVIAGLCFGLATLTRAVMLLFPVLLAGYLLWVNCWRRGVMQAAVLLVVYAGVVGVWTLHNVIRWERVVIGAEGYTAFLYLGAQDWEGAEETDADLDTYFTEDERDGAVDFALRQRSFLDGVQRVVAANPLGYAQRRLSNLVSAYAQPHGTTYFPGESLRALGLDWLRNDRTLGGLLRVMGADAFWTKLLVYLLHYAGLVLGVVGLWRCRGRWRVVLPLLLFIVYTTLVHLALLALPRYIFPTLPVWWCFAAVTVVRVWDSVRGRRGG